MDRFIKALMYSALLFFLYLTLAIVACFMMAGCYAVRYVPVESVSHDSVFVSRVDRDSIYVHDSIYIEVFSKADTIYQTKYVQKVVYCDVMRIDTMVVERVDTIRLPYPVERNLSKWEKIKLDFGGMSLGGIGIFVLSAVTIWLLRRKRNNI